MRWTTNIFVAPLSSDLAFLSTDDLGAIEVYYYYYYLIIDLRYVSESEITTSFKCASELFSIFITFGA